jgi:hypothetical protein
MPIRANCAGVDLSLRAALRPMHAAPRPMSLLWGRA